MSGEAVEYVRGIPVVKMFQQTIYSFKAFYAAIKDYSNLASQYAMSCRVGQTCFLTFINGAFALLIPAALLLASGGRYTRGSCQFYFLCAVCSCMRADDQPDHVYERGGHGGGRGGRPSG